MFGSFSGRAGGNIYPARFVVRSETSGEPLVTQAGANVAVWGISQNFTRKHGIFAGDANEAYAAISGDQINVIGPGDDEAALEIAGTIAAGDPIKSDADGKGVKADTDKDHVGAIAKHGGVSGDIIKVKPYRYDLAV